MKGWRYEGYRHSLAARGIRTSMKNKSSFQRFMFDKDEHDRVTELLEKEELKRKKRKKRGLGTIVGSGEKFRMTEGKLDELQWDPSYVDPDLLLPVAGSKSNKITPYYVERYMIDPETGQWRGKTSDAFLTREEAEARLAEVKAGPRVDPFIAEEGGSPVDSEINYRVTMGENIIDVLRDINERSTGRFMGWGESPARRARVRRLRQLREDEGRAEAVVDEAEREGVESSMQFEERFKE